MFKVLLFLLFNFFSLSSLSLDLSFVGNNPIFSGPNCHNTSLKVTDIMKDIRYIREDEMKSILKDSCNQGKGNIGVIEVGESNRPMHSFVKLNDKMVVTKDGVSKKAKVRIVSFDEMYALHKKAIKSYCKRSDIRENYCSIKVSYYSCKKLKSSKTEKLMSSFYDLRTKFFDTKNHELIILALRDDFREKRLNCSRFKSIKQSLEIANWNSRGPLEYENLKAFIEKMESDYSKKFCGKD